MMHTNDDRLNLGNLYSNMYNKPTTINEDYFPDVEDEADAIDGDLDRPIGGGEDEDGDALGDALEEKVYIFLNDALGDSFRRSCEEVKDKFDLSDEEFCMFFKSWFDKEHVDSHLADQV